MTGISSLHSRHTIIHELMEVIADIEEECGEDQNRLDHQCCDREYEARHLHAVDQAAQ